MHTVGEHRQCSEWWWNTKQLNELAVTHFCPISEWLQTMWISPMVVFKFISMITNLPISVSLCRNSKYLLLRWIQYNILETSMNCVQLNFQYSWLQTRKKITFSISNSLYNYIRNNICHPLRTLFSDAYISFTLFLHNVLRVWHIGRINCAN